LGDVSSACFGDGGVIEVMTPMTRCLQMQSFSFSAHSAVIAAIAADWKS